MNRSEKYYLRLLSPVHIGCDEAYEPMAFVLDETRRKIISFDPLDFYKKLSEQDKAEFSKICKKGDIASILELYKFMQNRPAQGVETGVSSGFIGHYRQVLSISTRDTKTIQQELNYLAISRTAFHPHNNAPYIPGSSLKGAMRTAYLNHLAKAHPVQDQRIAAKDLEEQLLGGEFQADPFSMLKISDFQPVGLVKKKIRYAVNRKKNPEKDRSSGPPQILEILEPGALFEGWISLLDPPAGSQIRRPLALEVLKESARVFYHKELGHENFELKSLGVPVYQPKMEGKAFLVRIGRHSGAECMTIEGHRQIRIMLGKGQTPKESTHSTTLWLAADDRHSPSDNLSPFGWAILAQTEAEVNEFLYEEKELNIKIVDKQPVKVQPTKMITPKAPLKKRLEPEKVSLQDYLNQLSISAANDKIFMDRMVKALNAFENERDAYALAKALKEKLEKAGTWKKHALRNEIEQFLSEPDEK